MEVPGVNVVVKLGAPGNMALTRAAATIPAISCVGMRRRPRTMGSAWEIIMPTVTYRISEFIYFVHIDAL